MIVNTSKLKYYKSIDDNAKKIARGLKNKRNVSEDILKFIIVLYKYAKVENKFESDFFESAYHNPVTSELEFFISRIIYHYSVINKLGWKIYLRRQFKKAVPDIRIEKANKTIAILEIKAKAGWIQPLLSKDKFDYDRIRFKNKLSDFNPEDFLKKGKDQFTKYKKIFNLSGNEIYFILPTLVHAHHKNYKKKVKDYLKYFETTTGLPRNNLILLSEDLSLDLSTTSDSIDLSATIYFERMINRLNRK